MTRVIHKTTPELTKYLWDEIPRELWGRARAKALTEGRSMKVVLEELVRAWVDEPAAAPPRDDLPSDDLGLGYGDDLVT